ncbi:extracellular mutant protein 11-domain-containing protein [Phialemonium atrogriseum]|uniref:Extracellular mutant protein 11-domain-containing protein n=1 Tax=Phialemonium atrogriseum TaxID=1093897 RepID=A0AAJ0FHQ6_9PEZI|nr:extracellular mutant protein 11-domain-containing protein [Phialemonium atrogriseum]KAK1767982.1 extracellular mutant protein 11-domain-containing protein [Phialemonium atrogriseum]
MRLSMMPTAKKKMGSMGMFVSRHADGPVSAPANGPASPRVGTTTAGPAAVATLQPSPQIVVSRQEIAAAAKIPVPRGGRFANQPVPASNMSPPAQHYHPMQRGRGSSETGRDAGHSQNGGGIWEDSTVASMFDETDSRGTSDRHRGQHGRHYSENTYSRPPQFERQRSHDDHLPFVIGENGMLKVVQQPAAVNGNGPSATTLNTSVQSGINEQQQQTSRPEASYQDDRHYENTPTRNNNTLRRTKLPHRDAREAKRNSFVERPEGGNPVDGGLNGSPGRRSDKSSRFIEAKVEDALRERERQRERELAHKRSTVFENLTPVEEPTWNTQVAVGMQTAEVTTDDIREALHHTPRASRQLPAIQNSLQGSPLARTPSRRRDKAIATRKRRLSLDYNDAELNAMNYADLQGQAFDFDPQAAALQQTSGPTGDSIEDKLEHYKDKDSIDQHRFFAQISLQDWEASGDWFLEQFSSVMQRMKTSRKTKREMMVKFESEISAREEAVRGKIEGIGRTLQDMKKEGQSMMQGKDVEV